MNSKKQLKALKMIISNHALQRMQQRGINDLAVNLLLSYGTRIHQSGSEVVKLDKGDKKRLFKQIKDLANHLEKLEKLYLIETDGVIVTAALQYKRLY